MEQQVILLNGPSSSGKSTLAKALQEVISHEGHGRYEVISIDDFMKISPTENLSSYPIRSVHITCPVDILKSRELARGDRCIGSAEASAEYLFPKEGYDLVVDTGTKSPAENALLIYHVLF